MFVCVYVTKWCINNIFTKTRVEGTLLMICKTWHADMSNTYYLWPLTHFAKARDSKNEKKTDHIAKLIKALCHCSLPHKSPDLTAVVQLGPMCVQINSKFKMSVPSLQLITRPVLFTSFRLPPPTLPPHVLGLYFIHILHHRVQPAPTQCHLETVPPESGANQPAPELDMLLSRCPTCTNEHGLVPHVFTNSRSQCS